MRLRPGRLDERVTISRPALTTDAIGGQSVAWGARDEAMRDMTNSKAAEALCAPYRVWGRHPEFPT